MASIDVSFSAKTKFKFLHVQFLLLIFLQLPQKSFAKLDDRNQNKPRTFKLGKPAKYTPLKKFQFKSPN